MNATMDFRSGRGALPWSRRFIAVVALLAAGLMLAGCSLTIPTDPHATLDRVEGGTLRVGASPDGVTTIDDEGEVTGPTAQLVVGYAQSIDARIEWTVSGEEDLVGMLEAGELDMAVGGMTDQTPWTDRVGITRGYPNIPGADGRALVMFVRLGENAFLSSLERYLDGEVAE